MNEDTIKVTQLPSAETITQNDLLMIVQNNENKKATSSQFVDMLDDELTNYYTKSETDDLLDDYTKTADLSAVATSGSYTDLSNTPTIPDMSETYGTSTTDGYSEAYLNNKLVNVGSSVDTDYRTNILSSKNLFDKDNANIGIFYIYNNKILTSTNDKLIILGIKPNTTYTIQKGLNATQTSNRFKVGTCVDTPANNVSLTNYVGYDDGTQVQEITITSGANDKYLVIQIANNQTNYDEIKDTIQIEQGSSATTYEPFIQNTINVNNEKYTDTINVGTEIDSSNRVNILHSHNLFDASIQVGTYESATYSVASDGLITQSASDGSSWNISQGRIFYLPAGTYTISIDVKSGVKGYIQLHDIVNNTDIVNTSGNSRTFTLTQTTALGFKTYGSGGTYPLSYYVMINKGNSILPYEPYLTPSINVDGEKIYNSNIMNYSTNEQVIGKWIDGKPIYRIVYQGQFANASVTSWTGLFTISNFDKAINVYGAMETTSNNSIPRYEENGFKVLISVNYLGKIVYKQSGYNNDKFHLVIEYTKTTD